MEQTKYNVFLIEDCNAGKVSDLIELTFIPNKGDSILIDDKHLEINHVLHGFNKENNSIAHYLYVSLSKNNLQ